MEDKISEGYVKFSCTWQKKPITVPEYQLTELQRWREKLYALHLVGAYPDGIGYGNISSLSGKSGTFVITGSTTGSLPMLTPEHYALVEGFNIALNTLDCVGLIKASSESLSHAAVYTASPRTGAVIHVHSKDLWTRHIDVLPTTDRRAEYGTPEMALEVSRIVTERTGETGGIVIMGGHSDGIITYGTDLRDAGNRIISLLKGETI